jgi:hypothetical protein
MRQSGRSELFQILKFDPNHNRLNLQNITAVSCAGSNRGLQLFVHGYSSRRSSERTPNQNLTKIIVVLTENNSRF